MVFTAFLLGAQHKSDRVENKPASLLVVSLSKALNGMPPSLCGRQMAVPNFYQSWYRSLNKDQQNGAVKSSKSEKHLEMKKLVHTKKTTEDRKNAKTAYFDAKINGVVNYNNGSNGSRVSSCRLRVLRQHKTYLLIQR